jgi:histone H3/H4
LDTTENATDQLLEEAELLCQKAARAVVVVPDGTTLVLVFKFLVESQHALRVLEIYMAQPQQTDDLDAVRTIVAALHPFQVADQERILRWVREKLGLAHVTDNLPYDHRTTSQSASLSAPDVPTRDEPASSLRPTDIKTFIQQKNPQSDNQFAAAVAYYYKFEAPPTEQKASITAADLTEACRQVGRPRIARPAQTLVNAHAQGYLDKTERGAYALNTVGENLVAMALPEDRSSGAGSTRRRKSKTATQSRKRSR